MRQTLDEYVEGRLAIGSCGLVVFVGVVLFIGASIFLKNLRENWFEYALEWLPFILMIAVIVLAVIVYNNMVNKKRASKVAGIIIMFGAIPQILMAIKSFNLPSEWEWLSFMGWFDILFAVVLVAFGLRVYIGQKE